MRLFVNKENRGKGVGTQPWGLPALRDKICDFCIVYIENLRIYCVKYRAEVSRCWEIPDVPGCEEVPD